jgi:hypothetical protein
MATPQVAIIGLKALQRDVDRLAIDGGWLAHELVLAGREALAPVLSAVVGALPQADEHRSDGHPAGTLAADVRISSNRAGAGIRMGRAKVNWAGPTEFGGYPAGREFISGGRYMYPAAQPLAGEVATMYSASVQRALDSFTWTNEGDTAHD